MNAGYIPSSIKGHHSADDIFDRKASDILYKFLLSDVIAAADQEREEHSC